MRAAAFALVAVSLAGCSLLIDLQPVPGVDGGPETSTDAPELDANDASVDAALDPNDCGANHVVCGSHKCVGGDCVRRMFVTSSLTMGSLGTAAGADNTCETLGTGLGEFVALLSVTDAGAAQKVGPSNAPFVLLDFTEVAPNAAALFREDGGLEHPIDMIEDGGALGDAEPRVWTGTWRDGGADFTDHCNEWIYNDSQHTAGAGSTKAKDANWLYTETPTCNVPLHLYCVEK